MRRGARPCVPCARRRAGFTLAEMMVVIAILGLVAGISTVALGALRPAPSARGRALLETARRQAVLTGRAVAVPADSLGADSAPVVFFPDGSAIGCPCRIDAITFAVDPLDGGIRVVDE